MTFNKGKDTVTKLNLQPQHYAFRIICLRKFGHLCILTQNFG